MESVLEKFKSTLLEDGIIESTIFPRIRIEEEDIREMKDGHDRLAENKHYSVLIIASDSDISKPARELASDKEFAGRNLSNAILVDSVFQRIIANMYLKVNRPSVPTKIFDKREAAISWLREQNRNHQDGR